MFYENSRFDIFKVTFIDCLHQMVEYVQEHLIKEFFEQNTVNAHGKLQ